MVTGFCLFELVCCQEAMKLLGSDVLADFYSNVARLYESSAWKKTIIVCNSLVQCAR